MPWGIAAGAAVGLVGSAMQSNATGKAAKSAANAQRDAQALLREDLAPYTEIGPNALLQTGNAAGLNGPEGNAAALSAFQGSPGYQWQLEQGLRAVDASASARGILSSGATQKAAMRYAQGLASQDFGAYYNRLMGMTQLAQNSAAGVGASGVQTAGGVAQTQMALGGAQASIYGNAAQGIGNSLNTYGNASLYQNKLAPGYDNTANLAQPGGYSYAGGPR